MLQKLQIPAVRLTDAKDTGIILFSYFFFWTRRLMFFSLSQFASVLIFTLPSLSCLTVGLPCGDSLIHQDSIDILVLVLPSLQLHEKHLRFSDKAEHFFWNRVCVCLCVSAHRPLQSVCQWSGRICCKGRCRGGSAGPGWRNPILPHEVLQWGQPTPQCLCFALFATVTFPLSTHFQPGYNYNTEWDIAHHPHTLCLTHITDFVFICCRGVGHMLTKKPLFWNCLRLGAMEIIQ